MSIPHGLDPSNFCRKMERTRPMMMEKDIHMFISASELALQLRSLFMKIVFTICTQNRAPPISNLAFEQNACTYSCTNTCANANTYSWKQETLNSVQKQCC